MADDRDDRTAAPLPAQGEELGVPPAGRRSEAIHRLQIGVFGLVMMALLIGLATVVTDRVQENEATAVPEAAPTIAPKTPAPQVKDPLVDAGVVPGLPAPAGAGNEAAAPAANAANEPPRR